MRVRVCDILSVIVFRVEANRFAFCCFKSYVAGRWYIRIEYVWKSLLSDRDCFSCFLFLCSYFRVRLIDGDNARVAVAYAEVNFVTAFVPSETACFANSPGKINLTEVWISLEVTVGFLLYLANFADSIAIFSKMSLMNEFMIDIAFEEIPVSGCTCFKTL